jgi:hypothetical protein
METTFFKLSTAHLNAQAFIVFFVSVPLVMVAAGNAVDD